MAELAEGLPVRSDVADNGPTVKQIEALLKGVKIWAPDWAQVVQDLEVDVAEYHRQTGS